MEFSKCWYVRCKGPGKQNKPHIVATTAKHPDSRRQISRYGWMQPRYMRIVSFWWKFTSGSRIRASCSDLLKLPNENVCSVHTFYKPWREDNTSAISPNVVHTVPVINIFDQGPWFLYRLRRWHLSKLCRMGSALQRHHDSSCAMWETKCINNCAAKLLNRFYPRKHFTQHNNIKIALHDSTSQ